MSGASIHRGHRTRWRIVVGDARERLAELDAGSVRCCVTSPPYFGLRDYGQPGQIGLEASPSEFVAALVDVFREVRRVLADDGTLWLNLGDSYAGSWGAQSRGATSQLADRSISAQQIVAHPKGTRTGSIPAGADYKAKDLLMIPAQAALGLRADGWWLRQEIIWHKRSPMPESVRDRCTRAHESLYMLAKSPRYFYDADAIAEPAVSDAPSGNGFDRGGVRLSRGGEGQEEKWDDVGGTRNRRDVWTLSSEPFTGAHFATFPTKLVEPCILAGSEPGDTILDPFSGSGTTGMVALRHGRSYVGIELNPEYADLSRRRRRTGRRTCGRRGSRTSTCARRWSRATACASTTRCSARGALDLPEGRGGPGGREGLAPPGPWRTEGSSRRCAAGTLPRACGRRLPAALDG